MPSPRTTALVLGSVAGAVLIAVGSWSSLDDSTPPTTTTRQEPAVSSSPTPDDFDEAAFKAQELAREDTLESPLEDFEGPTDPKATSLTIVIDADN